MVAFYFAITIAALVFMPTNTWLVIPVVFTLGYFSWICAVLTHNTIHHPIFVSKRLNKMMQVVLTLSYGHPVSAFVPGHNLSHHRFMQKPQDVMRTTKIDTGWNLLNAIVFVPSVALSVYKTDAAFTAKMKEKRPGWYRQLRVEFLALIAVSIAILLIDWQKFLLFFWLPHMIAAFGIIGINYFWHDGCDEDSEYNHSRNFTGKLFGWLTFNNGYHTIHHMKPSLHWSLLPDAHAELVRPFMHPNLEKESLLLYMWQTLIWPGKRITYLGEPVKVDRSPDVSWVTSEPPADASYGAE